MTEKTLEKVRLCRYGSPVGLLEIGEDGGGICRIGFTRTDFPAFREEKTPLMEEAITQLQEYFEGRRKCFDLPLAFHGTQFQKKVWQALREIPYGETRSYAQIAAAIGNPKACRAVGMANHVNEIVIVVPCHRVIGADGSLTGYGGGLEVKRKLLELEGIRF